MLEANRTSGRGVAGFPMGMDGALASSTGRNDVKTILVLGYLVVGVIVAGAKDYLGDIGGLSEIVNLVLAIVLWPLVLAGVDFNIKIGDNGGNGDGGGGDKKNGALLMVGSAVTYARAAVSKRLRSIRWENLPALDGKSVGGARRGQRLRCVV
jgi:hypothetical protein